MSRLQIDRLVGRVFGRFGRRGGVLRRTVVATADLASDSVTSTQTDYPVRMVRVSPRLLNRPGTLELDQVGRWNLAAAGLAVVPAPGDALLVDGANLALSKVDPVTVGGRVVSYLVEVAP